MGEKQENACLTRAIDWYVRGLVSQECAAMIAGLDRTDFLMVLAREKVDAFAVDTEALVREINL